MKTIITAKKMQIPQNFSEQAPLRIDSRLSKFFGDEADARIVMTEHKNSIQLELTVKYNSIIFRAECKAEDKMVALDDAIDKIIRQIRKNKTKIEKKLKDTAFKDVFADPVPEVSDYEVIRHKKFKMKPMDINEAILQMNMLGHEFYMFINEATGLVSVVYCLIDGGYGLLEPSAE